MIRPWVSLTFSNGMRLCGLMARRKVVFSLAIAGANAASSRWAYIWFRAFPDELRPFWNFHSKKSTQGIVFVVRPLRCWRISASTCRQWGSGSRMPLLKGNAANFRYFFSVLILVYSSSYNDFRVYNLTQQQPEDPAEVLVKCEPFDQDMDDESTITIVKCEPFDEEDMSVTGESNFHR